MDEVLADLKLVNGRADGMPSHVYIYIASIGFSSRRRCCHNIPSMKTLLFCLIANVGWPSMNLQDP